MAIRLSWTIKDSQGDFAPSRYGRRCGVLVPSGKQRGPPRQIHNTLTVRQTFFCAKFLRDY